MNIVDDIQAEIGKLQLQVAEIQKGCSHPEAAVTKKHGSNTGNYDPHEDCYWTDFKCGLCKKTWTLDGSH